MNEFDTSSREDDQRFDRLVDGEMSREEYNDLIGSLDQQPDGWRRCALAFLEAQAFRRDFGDLASDSQMPSQASSLSVPEKGRARRWRTVLAVAATFLVAFGMGLAFRDGWPGTPSGTEGMPIAGDNQRRESPDQTPRDTDIAETPTPDAGQPGQYRGNVRLVVDGPDGSGSQAIEAPLYELSPENAWMLSEGRLQIPPEVRRTFQRMGRELRWNQEVLPLETEDGQRVLVPFGQLEITPVGGQRYQ